MKPTLSIIIPIYNGAKFLSQAVHSIQQQEELPKNTEIWLIDDGSTDDTAAIAQQFSVNYYYQPQQGPASARNQGILITQGEFIAFLDVDDLWSPNKLKTHLAVLLAQPEISIVKGLIQEMHLNQSSDLRGNQENDIDFEFKGKPYESFHLGATTFRRSIFEQVGLLDETFWYGEDVEWFVRAKDKGVTSVVVPQISLYYRRHLNSLTMQCKQQPLGLTKALHKLLTQRQLLNSPLG